MNILTFTEFALVFQTTEYLQFMTDRIFPCISNKQIFSVTVTELNFVKNQLTYFKKHFRTCFLSV